MVIHGYLCLQNCSDIYKQMTKLFANESIVIHRANDYEIFFA